MDSGLARLVNSFSPYFSEMPDPSGLVSASGGLLSKEEQGTIEFFKSYCRLLSLSEAYYQKHGVKSFSIERDFKLFTEKTLLSVPAIMLKPDKLLEMGIVGIDFQPQGRLALTNYSAGFSESSSPASPDFINQVSQVLGEFNSSGKHFTAHIGEPKSTQDIISSVNKILENQRNLADLVSSSIKEGVLRVVDESPREPGLYITLDLYSLYYPFLMNSPFSIRELLKKGAEKIRKLQTAISFSKDDEENTKMVLDSHFNLEFMCKRWETLLEGSSLVESLKQGRLLNNDYFSSKCIEFFSRLVYYKSLLSSHFQVEKVIKQ
ncbi:MAG TPA: hypothetical protein ENN46_00955 [Candidatus Woesearchaeota archaeon]|nr:hypothetical protein [Candidatus Woesearchaeota archaeon]